MHATIMPPSEEKASTSSALELLQMVEVVRRFWAVLRQVKPLQRSQLLRLAVNSFQNHLLLELDTASGQSQSQRAADIRRRPTMGRL